MKGINKALVGSGLVMLSAQVAALSVTPTNSSSDLIDAILGSGISVDAGSVNYIGADGQAGFFTDGEGSGIGIDSGILLTSGSASDAVGPNTADNTGTGLGTAGDSDLDALVSGNTQDANVLEFEFSSTGGDLFFNYAFASEEYNEFVDSQFNDVFAFLLDGINIATVGDDEVSVNTVNCGGSGADDGSNCDQFNNNDPSDGGPFFDVAYDGFTNVFTASALGLSAGTHTLKLAIADRGDSILDSGVFIQADSVSDVVTPPTPTPTPSEVPEPGTLGLLGMALAGLGLRRRLK